MSEDESRDISVLVSVGELRTSAVAEGVSWSPDVCSDMFLAAVDAMAQLLAVCAEDPPPRSTPTPPPVIDP